MKQQVAKWKSSKFFENMNENIRRKKINGKSA